MKSILVLTVISFLAISVCAQKNAIISGDLQLLKSDGLTAILTIQSNGYSLNNIAPTNQTKYCDVLNGKFSFSISNITDYTSITIGFKRANGFWVQGYNSADYGPMNIYSTDSLSITDTLIEGIYVPKFEGRGSAKYNVGVLLNHAIKPHNIITPRSDNDFSYSRFLKFFNELDIDRSKLLVILNSQRSRLSEKEYSTLRNNILLFAMNSKMSSGPLDCISHDTSLLSVQVRKDLRRYFRSEWAKLDNSVKVQGLKYSNAFPAVNYSKYVLFDDYFPNEGIRKRNALAKIYTSISKDYSGVERDRLLAYAVLCSKVDSNYQKYLLRAISEVKDSDIIALLENVANSGSVGKKVPDFSFKKIDGETMTLSDFKGKLVVMDTWHWGCGACRGITPIMHRISNEYKNNPDVMFVSLCVATTKLMWLQGISSGIYSSEELINLWAEEVKEDGSNAYDYPFFKSFLYRGDPTVLMFDGDGKWLPFPSFPNMDNGADLSKKIKEFLENKFKKN